MKTGRTGSLLAAFAAAAASLPAITFVNALPPPLRIPDVLAARAAEIDADGTQDGQPLLQNGSGAEVTATKEFQIGGDVMIAFVDQILDHFGGGKDTFSQRYFYSPRYVHVDDSSTSTGGDRPSAAFLCVGGEGPSLDVSVLIDSVHCTGDMLGLARRLHENHGWDIHLFALEHRYYGQSFPGGDDALRSGDLPYLSSRQAVQDVAHFVTGDSIRAIVDGEGEHMEGDAVDVPWITFGGSYPGMVSAWSRLYHPDVIHGAVANSAPVQAKVDFGAYNERVGYDLADVDVGGSDECRRIFLEGHAQIVDALEEEDDGGDNGGLGRIADLFDVCGGADSLRSDPRNKDAFVGAGVVRIPAQENDPSCVGKVCNIDELCGAVTEEHDNNPELSSVEILAKINRIQKQNQCTDVSYGSFVEYLSTPSFYNANMRSWFYQTCTEFGFYQTCNIDSQCPYGRGYHHVDQDLESCKAIFGIEPDTVKEAVQSTLAYYGGWDLAPIVPNGKNASESWMRKLWDYLSGTEDDTNGASFEEGRKRILFANGDVDPWSELAVSHRPDKGEDETIISVKGGSHHFWTHEEKDSDHPAIVDARHEIYEVVAGYLGIDDFSPYVVSSNAFSTSDSETKTE